MSKFSERFAMDNDFNGLGGFCLTAVGCILGHEDRPRKEELLSKGENFRLNNQHGRRAYYGEMNTIAAAYQLKSMGLIPDPTMELEEWVEMHRELIGVE